VALALFLARKQGGATIRQVRTSDGKLKRQESFGLATSPPPVHLSAVADPHDEDQVLVVVDLVEDAIVPNTDAVLISSADF
jgi:hypothetical protein